ncbi:MAG: hypothetical protein ACYCZY_00020 [Lacisediminihabitans sp.]
MSVRERTLQQLDPAGTLGSRAITTLVACGALVYALVMTLRTVEQISHPLLAVLALLVLAAACGTLIVASSPYRAPFSRQAHALVHSLVLLAVVLSVASAWGANRYVQDDWGPISLGLVLVALGSYRPARELAGAGVLSAIFLGFLTLLQVPALATKAPSIAFVVVAVTPMLALCFGSVMFFTGIVNSLERWQHRANRATSSLADQLRDGIARSVQQDRVTILNRDVLPFFTEVLTQAEITDADRDRARAIAESIRSVMVAEVDRSWLESVIQQAGGSAHGDTGSSSAVHDTERLVPLMMTDQRTALRALIVALFEEPSFDPASLSIALRSRGDECRGVLIARLGAADHAMRAVLAPFFAVMRVVFSDLQVEFLQPTLTLRFSYAQH